MNPPHMLVLEWGGGDNPILYRVECPNPATCAECWEPGPFGSRSCRCGPPLCDACADDWHEECVEIGGFMEGTPMCRMVPVVGCGLAEWVEAVGGECVEEIPYRVVARVPVAAVWPDPSALVLRPETETTTPDLGECPECGKRGCRLP